MSSLAEASADGAVAGSEPGRRPAPTTILLGIGVGLVAFLVRIVPVLAGGGLHSWGRYDDGVYYSAADSLLFGHLPYRDFVMLHPPGLLLTLVPFAELGRLTSDATGLAAGRITFMAIGALNAVLVAMFAKRWGRPAAITAGLLYACWMPAVYGEQSTLLEPLGTTATLVGLLLVCRPGVTQLSRRTEVLAGVALGLAVTFKIWYLLPLLVVVVWQLSRRRVTSASRIAAGGVAAVTVVLGPFFVAAPGRMFHMVVLDQMKRSGKATSPFVRLPYILGVRPLANGHHSEIIVCTAIAIVIVVVAGLLSVSDATARVVLALAAADVLVLMITPAFFLHYGELTAPPLALVVGIGVGKLKQRITRPALARVVVAGFAVAIAASGVDIITTPTGKPFPVATFAAAAPPGCIAADDPTGLIEMNRLTSDLRLGCVVPVDVSGITYDRLDVSNAAGVRIGRGRNELWQRYLHDYLFSGTAFVVLREQADAITPPYRGMVKRAPVLSYGDGLVLRSGLNSGPTSVRGVKASP